MFSKSIILYNHFSNFNRVIEFFAKSFTVLLFLYFFGMTNHALAGGGCSIDSITVGAQTACDSLTNTYTQQLTIHYTNPPPSGALQVNNQMFPIQSSPQIVTLTELQSRGTEVDVTADFTLIPVCTLTDSAAFTAADYCFLPHGVSDNWGEEIEIPRAVPAAGARGVVNNNMVMSSEEKIIIFYTEEFPFPDGPRTIRITCSEDSGQSWLEPPDTFGSALLTNGTCCPKVALDVGDSIHVIWQTNIPKAIYYAKLAPDLSTIIDTAKITDTVDYEISGTSITVDRQDRVHVSWHDGTENSSAGISRVKYARSANGGYDWEAPKVLSNNPGKHSFYARADFNGTLGDTLAMCWRDSIGPNDWDVMVGISTNGGRDWTTTLGAGGLGSQWDPSIIVDRDNTLHLSFHEYPLNNPYDGALVLAGSSTDLGASWDPSDFVEVSRDSIRSHLIVYHYDYAYDILWNFWKDEPISIGPDVMAAYSKDKGATWSEPEFITDWGELPIGLKGAAVSPNGTVGMHYEVVDSTGRPILYYRQRISGGSEIALCNGLATPATVPKISATSGNLTAILEKKWEFGSAVEHIGDLNGDGYEDLVVGAQRATIVSPSTLKKVNRVGALYVLFLDSTGAVNSHQKISIDDGGYPTDSLGTKAQMGGSVTCLGDLDGDGVNDIAVGVPGHTAYDADGKKRKYSGAVDILFLKSDGTVKNMSRIANRLGGLSADIDKNFYFGTAVENIGDLDSDGTIDLAVGAVGDNNIPEMKRSKSGGVYIIGLKTDGSVKWDTRISADIGGLDTLTVNRKDAFGSALCSLGDLDSDGVLDIAVGADGYTAIDEDIKKRKAAGAVHILYLNSNGTVKAQSTITYDSVNLVLKKKDYLGKSIDNIGDLDDDGIVDIAIGASGDDQSNKDGGAVYVVNLNVNGSEKAIAKVFPSLGKSDMYGSSVSAVVDTCKTVLIAGAIGDDDGLYKNEGAIWFSILPDDIESNPLKTVPASLTASTHDDADNQEDLKAADYADGTQAVTIFPNPNDGRFFIRFSDVLKSPSSISIYDVFGKMIYKTPDEQEISNNALVSLKDVPSGVYLLKVLANDLEFESWVLVTGR